MDQYILTKDRKLNLNIVAVDLGFCSMEMLKVKQTKMFSKISEIPKVFRLLLLVKGTKVLTNVVKKNAVKLDRTQDLSINAIFLLAGL